MRVLGDLFGNPNTPPEGDPAENEEFEGGILQEDQKEEMEMDRSVLMDDTQSVRRVSRQADQEVVSAAEESLKRLHVIQRGRCPECGSHLRRHLFASICESCGWHRYDRPRRTPVRVHLTDGSGPIEGDRCYQIKTDATLVVKNDVVIAKVPRGSLSWIEYVWSPEELDQRHRQVVERMDIACGWCAGPADPQKDGFHLVHVAFGASQERYCFCSDDCYESFRKMYPARVDRDCYERNCTECNLCVKRYEDEEEGIRLLAKDYLQADSIRRKIDSDT